MTDVIGYGYGSQLMGETHWAIDSWYILFSNHGCNFTFNYGADTVMELSENTVSLDSIAGEMKLHILCAKYFKNRKFSDLTHLTAQR